MKYNRLEIIEDLGMVNITTKSGTVRKKHRVNVKCDCGNIRTVCLSDIKNGRTKSCGCYIKDITSDRSKKHCKTGDRFYIMFAAIKARCYNKNHPAYYRYGGRGIKICDEWLNDFNSFYNWLLNSDWCDGLQIDRIDNNGDYEPNNCRFVTRTENVNNRGNTIFLEHNGETLPISVWARKTGIGIETIRRRIFKYNWGVEKALTKLTYNDCKGICG
jgi:hypothetical protein